MGKKAQNLYITITGTNHYYGKDFLKEDMTVFLMKEPENDYDKEAIQVTLPGLGCIGYVANSPYTVLGESISAGRLYDKISHHASAKVCYLLPRGVVCRLKIKE